MKWNELTLKDRKNLYNNIKLLYPNTTYLELKNMFNKIPLYEEGKGSESQRREALWKEYKLSIGKDTSSINKYHRPADFNPSSGNRRQLSDMKLFSDFDKLPQLLENNLCNVVSQSGENIKEAAIKTNDEKYEKTRQGLAVAGILGQAALSFLGSAAGAMGKSAISSSIGASQAIWDAYEDIDAISKGDNLSILQNSVPLGLYMLGNLKYLPKFRTNRNVETISKFGTHSGLIWDWGPNPIIEGFKIKRDRD